MALTAEQEEALVSLLERERRKLVRRLRRFGEEVGERGDAGGFSQHMAEAAAESTEREKAALMASEEGRRLIEVDHALQRLSREPESYDLCRACGGEIAFERLEALPYTDLCIECKRSEEGGVGR